MVEILQYLGSNIIQSSAIQHHSKGDNDSIAVAGAGPGNEGHRARGAAILHVGRVSSTHATQLRTLQRLPASTLGTPTNHCVAQASVQWTVCMLPLQDLYVNEASFASGAVEKIRH